MIIHLEHENHNKINTIFNSSINNASRSIIIIRSKINFRVFFQKFKIMNELYHQ